MDNRREVPFFIDKSGREVKVGDFVVYGHSLGRCAGLRFGKVLKIEILTRPSWHADQSDNEEWRIRVKGIDDDWDKDIASSTAAREGTLQYPSRILAVNDIIPEDYKDLLKTV